MSEHTAAKDAGHGTTCDGCLMLAMVKRAEEAEAALDAEIASRDEAQEWADRLAYAIATQEVIGEHSSANNPWANALDVLDTRVLPPAEGSES